MSPIATFIETSATRTASSIVSKTIVALVLAGTVCCFSPGVYGQQGGAAKSAVLASAATPRTADGHPDLSGLWNAGAVQPGSGVKATSPDSLDPSIFNARQTEGRTGNGGFINFERDNTILRRMGSNKPQYKPKYWDLIKRLDQGGNTEDPGGNCMPPGVPRVGPPTQVVQTPTQLVLLYVPGGASGFAPTYRIFPIDGRSHTKLEDLDGTWNGESIGHWDGDTMVVDTIGFNTGTWLDIEGYVHSENMHVVERLHREGNTLTWQATVEDPDMLLKPWVMNTATVRLNPDPKAVLPEPTPCSERDYAHAVTKEHH